MLPEARANERRAPEDGTRADDAEAPLSPSLLAG